MIVRTCAALAFISLAGTEWPVTAPLTYAVECSEDDTVSWSSVLDYSEETGEFAAEGSVFLAYLNGAAYYGPMITGDVMFRVPEAAFNADDIAVIEEAYDNNQTMQVTWNDSGNLVSWTIL